MLALLLDEQISPVVAEQIAANHPRAAVQSIYRWREGTLTAQDDGLVLQTAAKDGLTLVTYDLKTIPLLLAEWGAAGISHAGIVFVDNRTIRCSDFGGLIRALVHLWDRERDHDWRDRIVFLEAR